MGVYFLKNKYGVHVFFSKKPEFVCLASGQKIFSVDVFLTREKGHPFPQEMRCIGFISGSLLLKFVESLKNSRILISMDF